MDQAHLLQTDALGRPRERILLLSGLPGFGKTTLAHVLTKQAGYRTLEINASDDRNAATVSTRIKNAIEAGGGIMDKGRPVCVVVDEIDGATGGDQVCPAANTNMGAEKIEAGGVGVRGKGQRRGERTADKLELCQESHQVDSGRACKSQE